MKGLIASCRLLSMPRRLFVSPAKQWTESEVRDYKNQKKITTDFYEQEMKDLLETKKMMARQIEKNYQYKNIAEKWKNDLINKKKRRERKLERIANTPPPQSDEPKLVVHSAAIDSIEINKELRYDSFAVMTLKGSQHKVCMDDVLIVNRMDELNVGECIEVEDVNLIGNKYFTLIGRPLVNKAKVVLSLEEQTYTEKIIVFKKKRRKGYKKNMGYSHPISVFRVVDVDYEVSEELASKAVPVD